MFQKSPIAWVLFGCFSGAFRVRVFFWCFCWCFVGVGAQHRNTKREWCWCWCWCSAKKRQSTKHQHTHKKTPFSYELQTDLLGIQLGCILLVLWPSLGPYLTHPVGSKPGTGSNKESPSAMCPWYGPISTLLGCPCPVIDFYLISENKYLHCYLIYMLINKFLHFLPGKQKIVLHPKDMKLVVFEAVFPNNHTIMNHLKTQHWQIWLL